jgi:hypothetical protein
LKKPTGSVRFRFIKPGTGKTEPKKTEPNRKNRAKPSQNRAKPKKPSQTGFCSKKPNRTEPKPVGLNRFRFGFGFFFKKKKFGLVTFFDKNRTEPNREHP